MHCTLQLKNIALFVLNFIKQFIDFFFISVINLMCWCPLSLLQKASSHEHI